MLAKNKDFITFLPFVMDLIREIINEYLEKIKHLSTTWCLGYVCVIWLN